MSEQPESLAYVASKRIAELEKIVEEQRQRIHALIDGCERYGLEGSTPVVVRIARMEAERDKLQHDLGSANKLLDLHTKYRVMADGKWIDGFGACRVCNGEIPHGHVGDCDVYKMEQTIKKLQARIDALMLEYCPNAMTPEQKANYEANQTAEG